MPKIKGTFLTNSILFIFVLFVKLSNAQGIPLWTPAPGSNPTQTVAENMDATIVYTVSNLCTNKNIPAGIRRLAIKPLPGLMQQEPCYVGPKGSASALF